jgi:hypothetical protein
LRRDTKTEGDGNVATILRVDSAKNDSSSFARDMLYSTLLKGCQMYAAKGRGFGNGGIQNETGSIWARVLSCTPTMIGAFPMTESPKSKKEHVIWDRTQPDDVN